MAVLNGYEQYKDQSINMMTQGELLILLYDEMSKRLLRAKLAIGKENWDEFEASVTRTRDIVTYLRKGLNMDYEISYDLFKMYDFFMVQLSRISAGRRESDIDELIPLVKELRDTFKEADRLAGSRR